MNASGCHRPARSWAARWVPAVMLVALALLWAMPLAAAEPAGRVISLVGTVRAVDPEGDTRALARGDAVHAGDTLTLGPRAHTQIRMRDDALIELEAGTRFAIPVYSESVDGGSAVMRLLRGAMRTITGAIGDGPEETYQVDTPVATIGIRGTEYALHHCDADCAGEERDIGLYGRVDAGAVAVHNQAAERVYREREYFYVAARDVAPREIVRPPPGILDGGAVTAGALRSGSGDGELLDTELDDGLGSTIDSTGSTLDDTLDDTTDFAANTLGDDLDTGETLDDTTDLANDTLDGADDSLGDTVDDTTDTINDTLDTDLQ